MKFRLICFCVLILTLLFTACSHTTYPDKDDQTKDSNTMVQEEGNVSPNQEADTDGEQMTSAVVTEDTILTDMEMTNPLLWSDVPDPDVIRVGDYYYMVSTTMHFVPGVPIMRSTDLANWEIISYVYDQLADDEKHNLASGENIYSKGSWAASLRYHEGIYYVCFASYDTNKTYIYKTESLENGPWTHIEIPGVYHDPSLLFDEGRVYLVYGNGTIKIIQLNDDVSGLKYAGFKFDLFNAAKDGNYVNMEGSHIYKINGYYYIFCIEWPNTGTQRRTEWCFRSRTVFGDYEGKVVFDDSFNYGNSGVAQGGIVDTPTGDYYAVLFQDHGAVGRIPILLPVTWEDGWPMMGVDGKTPATLTLESDQRTVESIVANDDFDYNNNKLKLPWQWNHNPDNILWSVIERPGYLRITTGSINPNILSARNTLTQRTLGPSFTGEIKLDTTGMKPGDYAGIAAFQSNYGMLAVKVDEKGNKYVIAAGNNGTGNPKEQFITEALQDNVYLKIEFKFSSGTITALTAIDKAYFYYSFDGKEWLDTGYELKMQYTLDHFVGYRSALFHYATQETGGYADFDYYHLTSSTKY